MLCLQLVRHTKLTMSSSKRVADTARGTSKQPRVSNKSSTSSRTNASVIATSKSASMRSTAFVSPNGKSSLEGDDEQHDEDGSENRSKPSHVWLEQHTLTDLSTIDQTTVNLVVTDTVFPKVKFVDRDTELVFSKEKNPFVNMSLRVATCTPISHHTSGGSTHRSMSLKPLTVSAMIATLQCSGQC